MGGQRGFTLIELMVTVSIAVILMTIAVPSFIEFTRNNRLTVQSADIVADLQYARSEAIRRGTRTTVCPGTSAGCSGSTTWDGGWISFVDANWNGAYDAGTDTLLRVRGALEGGNTMRGGRARITFSNLGYANNPPSNDTLRLCDARGTASGRTAAISSQGRITTGTGPSSCP